MKQTDIEPQSAQVPSHVSVEDVLKMEFFTPGEAREFYTSYSRLKGFAIRKSKRFVDDHNHTLLSKRFIGYLPSHRNMSDVEIAQMNSMRQVGISIPKIYQSFAMQNGDVNAALRFFKRAAKNDEKLFWRYEVAAGSRMCDIIWSDGWSQEDYEAFGGVLAFDATYGRNKYNLPVIVLSGVNHHNQTCVFAAAMVSCE
ncbi:protein FAR-RED IMPAIRED RESPONSE 1-like [Arachis ipaensis]|uniref:protein FAR-RED IMPAIRED RESPONSE 1-like n=1 Tax=Arachis ipaensis TaxID=130454 RepID=UPI0007AFCF52|nr:protein FAR-RED IMPAIRED RESPONSE 1-like [Arachis ipaensis]